MSEQPKLKAIHREDTLRVATEDLRRVCDASALSFDTTDDVEPLRKIIGQDDAVDSLRFGLEIFAPGQNVFVRGLAGTGRLTLVSQVLGEVQTPCAPTPDYCYVANFDRPQEPILLTLQRGTGRAFAEAMDSLIDFMTGSLGSALTTDDMRARRHFLDERYEDDAKTLSKPFEEELAAADLGMVSVKVGNGTRPAILPLIDGEPAPPERIQQLRANGTLSEEQMTEIEEKISKFAKSLEGLALRMRAIGEAHADAVRELLDNATRDLLAEECEAIRRTFGNASVGPQIDAIIDDVLRRGVDKLVVPGAAARRYGVNVVLGHGEDEPCPVVVEGAPTLANLLGTVERSVQPDGSAVSDHLMIFAGSLLRANGGYLILEARELLREPGAWKVLMRSLRAATVEIVPAELSGPWSARSIKPEPIPLAVKVVLIGDPGMYQALDAQDPDFPHLFKVLADFDSSLERTLQSVEAYAGLFARIAEDEGLPAFDRDAVAALVEQGARIAGNNARLTTRFGRLVDIAREAAFLTNKRNDKVVTGDAVREAIRNRKRRGDLPARKFRRNIADGTIHVATRGAEVGQVNGLAVIKAGPLVYGFPARITATIGAGHAGMINVERESQLSGAIHTKGFHILRGLLRHLLQTQHPLAFSASIAFEQSYGGIDGDSASGAEMCCLMSALTGIPLRQDLAMTGAIDQHGRILPIGGATEKIEGFFDACADAGLTGEQGVILPRSNVRDLMLREDVVEACGAGRFHVYAVESIHQALELFTGVVAGERSGSGDGYGEGTLLHRAEERAFDYWSLASIQPVWEDAVEGSEDDAEAQA